jgi:hypothetical protein
MNYIIFSNVEISQKEKKEEEQPPLFPKNKIL